VGSEGGEGHTRFLGNIMRLGSWSGLWTYEMANSVWRALGGVDRDSYFFFEVVFQGSGRRARLVGSVIIPRESIL
jgi:hypothetical protein